MAENSYYTLAQLDFKFPQSLQDDFWLQFAISNKLRLQGHIKILLGMCWLMSNGTLIKTKCL